MDRYYTPKQRKEQAGWGDGPLLPSLSVPDLIGAPTGILGPDGYEIWRRPRPIGFGRDDEWA